MEEPSHARAVSLVLALSVVAGGWMFFEYSNRQAELSRPPAEQLQSPPVPALQSTQPTPSQMASRARATVPGNLTFKCERGGRVSYGDQPCGEKATTVAITASEQEPPAKNNLQQLQERLAVMEASRMEREKASAARTVVFSPTASPGVNDSKAFSCKAIDQEIAAKDSALRQPHFAQWGDYLTGERKKLTDQRFSLGC